MLLVSLVQCPQWFVALAVSVVDVVAEMAGHRVSNRIRFAELRLVLHHVQDIMKESDNCKLITEIKSEHSHACIRAFC